MAGSKNAPTVRGADKARTGKEAVRSKQQTSNLYQRQTKTIPKWNVTEYKPPRKISDRELEAARKMFFELDRDGSGSIDAEELGMMLRSLGQNPTEEELIELINSVDEGEKDGQIQLREFLKLYTQGLDAKKMGKAGKEDVTNVYSALGVRRAPLASSPHPTAPNRSSAHLYPVARARRGRHAACSLRAPQGDPQKEGSVLDKAAVREYLLENYELDTDSDVICKGDTVTTADLESFLLEK